MINNQKGFVVPLLLAIIAILVIGSGVYVYNNKKAETSTLSVDTEVQTTNQTKQQTNIQEPLVDKQTSTSNWKTYNFTGSPYIESGPISFKYPSDWKLDFSYYTTPGGSKDITSISITSPSGIEQIGLSNGGRQATLNCEAILKLNNDEPRGRVVCKMINGTPFYLTYTTNEDAVEIYNKIISSIK